MEHLKCPVGNGVCDLKTYLFERHKEIQRKDRQVHSSQMPSTCLGKQVMDKGQGNEAGSWACGVGAEFWQEVDWRPWHR